MKEYMKHLRFEEIKSKGKTKIFDVYSNHSNDFLGRIHYRSGWRNYVMSYEPNIDMSVDCNDELNNFMKKLEAERYVIKMMEKKK